MLSRIDQSPLYRVANPRSIVFFGGSNKIESMGTNILMSLLGMGFDGPVFPVHPKEKTVQGLTAYASVLDLPVTPDLAVMVLPTASVNPTIEQCGRMGIRQVVVVSGGFKEVGGEGPTLEYEMVEICRRYGITLIGPNCLGVANPHHKLNTTFLPFEGRPGFIGLASQSGSFITQMFNYMARHHLGFSTAFSVGNSACIDIVDCLDYLGACPHTRVITLYIEGLTRGRAFVETARAISPQKPIVALYVGGSPAGRKAGSSHTGAMAGPDRLYDGIFRQAGIIRAANLTELFDFAWVLGTQPKPRSRGVVIQTHSGGPGAVAADAVGRTGLTLPDLSVQTLEALQPYVPHTGSVANPVDLTFSKNPMDFFAAIPKVLLEDNNVAMLMVYFLIPLPVIRRAMAQMGVAPERLESEAGQMVAEYARAFSQLHLQARKPVVGYTWRGLEERFVQLLMENGVPLFPEPERAARALAALVRYHEWRKVINADPVTG
ncbi:MAG: CoA-binding protein [Proteobacteria bacterium]|nr:CoA-binding protein [Pseudomonadota bacterium]